jgi:hypothetical protein
LVTIYPNPTNGSLRIQHREPISEIRIVDATGRQVQPIVIDPSIQENEPEGKYGLNLDLSNFSSGVYSLLIFSNQALMVRKIIVTEP